MTDVNLPLDIWSTWLLMGLAHSNQPEKSATIGSPKPALGIMNLINTTSYCEEIRAFLFRPFSTVALSMDHQWTSIVICIPVSSHVGEYSHFWLRFFNEFMLCPTNLSHKMSTVDKIKFPRLLGFYIRFLDPHSSRPKYKILKLRMVVTVK